MTRSESLALLRATLQAIAPLAAADWEHYASCWRERSFKRGEPITVPGQVQREMLFITEGYQKSFYLSEGKEHVMAFTYRCNFSGIPDSYLRQRPSHYHLEAISETKALAISYEQDMAAINRSHSLERIMRIYTEELLIGLIDRHRELQSQTIAERFAAFVSRSGFLLNAIPHKDIASYLRIDPSNFSKLLNSQKV